LTIICVYAVEAKQVRRVTHTLGSNPIFAFALDKQALRVHIEYSPYLERKKRLRAGCHHCGEKKSKQSTDDLQVHQRAAATIPLLDPQHLTKHFSHGKKGFRASLTIF